MEEELEREVKGKEAWKEGTRKEEEEDGDMGESARKKASDRVSYDK